MSKDKEDKDMTPLTKIKLEEANKKLNKVLPNLWEKAKKYRRGKKKYYSKNGV